MKKITPSSKQTDFEKLQKFFDGIQKEIQELNHNQKISGQKNDNSYKDLTFRIMAEAASTRQKLEESLRAEIQVANTELKNELRTEVQGANTELKSDLKNMLNQLETRLNKRITNVGDLITIQLSSKIQNHEKKINKLEKAQQLA